MESVTLHKCTLQGKALQPVQRFKADGWIRGAPGSTTNPIRLLPAQAALQEVPWTMLVHTGRQKGDTRAFGSWWAVELRCMCFNRRFLAGAGTDATIYFSVDMHVEVHFCQQPFEPVTILLYLTICSGDARQTMQLYHQHSAADSLPCRMTPHQQSILHSGLRLDPPDGEGITIQPRLLRGWLCGRVHCALAEGAGEEVARST